MGGETEGRDIHASDGGQDDSISTRLQGSRGRITTAGEDEVHKSKSSSGILVPMLNK